MRPFFTKDDFLSAKGRLPFSDDVRILGDPVAAGGSSAPSRIVYQPMEGCDGEPDGSPGELTVRRYERFASGGPGIIWFEAVAVLREGRANPRQLMLTGNNIGSFSRLVEDIKETAVKAGRAEPLVIMQATHSGRYSKPDGSPEPLVAFRRSALEKNGAPVTVVTDEYLDRAGEAIVRSAKLAERSGFDGVDVKSCHGYLLSELLSARERDGKYGGAFENRTRLLLGAVSGVRAACGGGFTVATRLNVYDGAEIPGGFGVAPDGSFDPAEPEKLARELARRGVSLINVTMGNPYFNPHVNRPFSQGAYDPPESPLEGVARLLRGAETVKRAAPSVSVVASGFSFLGAAAPNVAAAYAANGSFDLCGFGRAAIAYPDLAADILLGGGMKKEKLCLCCSKCTEIMRKPGGTPGCVVRDAEKYLPIYREFCGEGSK
ncbi:MAG: flavin oxidoreductase/NADH oxidase [Clostridia bacterium]|nr:flavin oxidoreductase/NADH oxidase [Clostridia bacterium]